MRACGDEIDVGLNGETRGGKNAVAAKSVIAREASGFDEAQPLLDAAGLGAVAIVIQDAFAPGETKREIFAAREDGRVFDGDAALIVVTIEGPGLQLSASELAFVHEQMKWVLVVVALFADRVKTGNEFGL